MVQLLTVLYDGAAARDVMREAGPALSPGAAWAQSTTAGVEAVAELAALPPSTDWSSTTPRSSARDSPPRQGS